MNAKELSSFARIYDIPAHMVFGEFTPYFRELTAGVGHRGALRMGDFQIVLTKYRGKFDVFKNGTCVETGFETLDAAKQFVKEMALQ